MGAGGEGKESLSASETGGGGLGEASQQMEAHSPIRPLPGLEIMFYCPVASGCFQAAVAEWHSVTETVGPVKPKIRPVGL